MDETFQRESVMRCLWPLATCWHWLLPPENRPPTDLDDSLLNQSERAALGMEGARSMGTDEAAMFHDDSDAVHQDDFLGQDEYEKGYVELGVSSVLHPAPHLADEGAAGVPPYLQFTAAERRLLFGGAQMEEIAQEDAIEDEIVEDGLDSYAMIPDDRVVTMEATGSPRACERGDAPEQKWSWLEKSQEVAVQPAIEHFPDALVEEHAMLCEPQGALGVESKPSSTQQLDLSQESRNAEEEVARTEALVAAAMARAAEAREKLAALEAQQRHGDELSQPSGAHRVDSAKVRKKKSRRHSTEKHKAKKQLSTDEANQQREKVDIAKVHGQPTGQESGNREDTTEEEHASPVPDQNLISMMTDAPSDDVEASQTLRTVVL